MGMTNTFHSSGKGHAIGGAGKLSGVQRHNERGYFSFDYDATKIHCLVGNVNTLADDVQHYINEHFQSAIDKYNESQPRKDRKITKTPFEYFCDNKNLDIANEAIFQVGDKDFWGAYRIESQFQRNGKAHTKKSFPTEIQRVMDDIFLRQARAYEEIYATHSGEILARIQQDYEFSKRTMAELEPSEVAFFTKLAKKKEKDRAPFLKTEEQKERFGRFLSASSTIDFVEKKRIMERIEDGDMSIQLVNLTAHYDESSPHAHGVSVCSVRGFENGVSERVAKSVVLNKWALGVIQDVLHEVAKEEMAKYPEIFTVPLEDKQEGRNYDYYVAEYKVKREKEKAEAYKQEAASAYQEAQKAKGDAEFERQLAKQEAARADAAHNRAEEANRNAAKARREALAAQDKAERLKEEVGVITAELNAKAELRSLAEYQAQVIENDKELDGIVGAVEAITEQGEAEGLGWGAVGRLIAAALDGMAQLIEALRIKIAKVQLFEYLHDIFENAAGKRQEKRLDAILGNACDRSEEQYSGGTLRGKDDYGK